jgi:hypothetical protein
MSEYGNISEDENLCFRPFEPLPIFLFHYDGTLDQSSSEAIFDQFADEKTSPSVFGKSVHLTS